MAFQYLLKHVAKQLRRVRGAAIVALVLFPLGASTQMLNFSAWQQQLSLTFTTAAQAIFNKNCSSVVTVQSSRSGAAYLVPADLTVDLSGPANLTFYSDQACTTAITSVIIASGSSSKSFYFVDTVNASATITATATGTSFAPVMQTETLSTNGFVWTGALSAAWSTAGNWSGNAVPTSTSRVVFDDSCSTNCSPTISADVSVQAVRMAATYSGTLAQGAFNFTVASPSGDGSTGFAQLAGTFTGSADGAKVLFFNQAFATIAGGVFTAPVGTLTAYSDWTILNSPAVTFPSGSTLNLQCTGSNYCYSRTIYITPGSVNYQNVTFSGRRTTYDLKSGTMTVLGNMQAGDISLVKGINTGTVNLAGNLTVTTALGNTGGAAVILTGNAGGQTITNTFGGELPSIELATGANAVTLVGTVKTRKFTVTSVGTFTVTGSTLQLYCESTYTSCGNATSNLNLGTVTYNNLTFNGYSTSWNLGGGTVTVAGNLAFGDRDSSPSGERINNGTLNVTGNITGTDYGYYGTAWVVAKGNPAGQTITGVTGRGFPRLSIDAGANPITISGTIQTTDYNYIASGTFTSTGSTFRFYCTASINLSCASATKTLTFGAVTYNHLTFNGYSTNWDLNGSTVAVAGDLTFGDLDSGPSGERISSGTINVTGQNITANSYGYFGSAWVVAKGNAAGQIITGVTGRGFPMLKIEAGVNPVTLVGEIRTIEYTYVSSGAFTSTGSTIYLYCTSSIGLGCATATKNIPFGNVTYDNIKLLGYDTIYDFGAQTVTVAGDFTWGDGDTSPTIASFNNGTFQVTGNVTQTNKGPTSSTATVIVTGNPLGQTITGISGERFLPLQINAGANPVTLSGTIKSATYTFVSAGTFTTAGSTLDINCVSSLAYCANTTRALTLGSKVYDNVSFNGYGTTWDLGGATLNVGGNLSIADTNNVASRKIDSGTIKVSGNVNFTGTIGSLGNAAIQFVGSGPQSMTTGHSNMPSGTITVDKPSGTLSLLSSVSWNKAGQSMTITSGVVDMAGFNLTVNNVLTIDTGTTLTQNLGILTYGSLVNNGTLNP